MDSDIADVRAVSVNMGARAPGTVRADSPVLRRSLTTLTMLLVATLAVAQGLRITNYEYDAAGNIIGIVTSDIDGPPVIDRIEPGFISRGQGVQAVAEGRNLFNTELSTSTPGLSISGYTVESDSLARFQLDAALDAPIGPGLLRFVNALGATDTGIAIAERVPIISSYPNPIVLRPGDPPREIRLAFDAPFESGLDFDVSIRDAALATIDRSAFTLTAGETEVVLMATGLLDGVTTLDIRQPQNFLSLGVQVFVTSSTLPNGQYSAASYPLGVTVLTDTPRTANTLISAPPVGVAVVVENDRTASGTVAALPVGVAVVVEDQRMAGSTVAALPVGVAVVVENQRTAVATVAARPVGVATTTFPVIGVNNSLVTTQPVGVAATVAREETSIGAIAIAPQLGVTAELPTDDGLQIPLVSASNGVTLGPAVDELLPSTASRGASITLTLRGVELDGVVDIAFRPGGGIQVVGPLQANPAGSELSVALTIDAGAGVGLRVLEIETATGPQLVRNSVLEITP